MLYHFIRPLLRRSTRPASRTRAPLVAYPERKGQVAALRSGVQAPGMAARMSLRVHYVCSRKPSPEAQLDHSSLEHVADFGQGLPGTLGPIKLGFTCAGAGVCTTPS